MDEIFEKLSKYGLTEMDKPLSSMTTLRIGGNARYIVYPKSDVALDFIFRLIQEYDLQYKVIGKGSDLLCSDDYFDGVIIRLDKYFLDTYIDEDEIVVQAGCSIISLAVEAMKKGLSGLEFASGIPGTVGGAIFMNAGAYKSSMSEIVKDVFVYRNGKFEWISVDECEFGYRKSIFQKNRDWIILGARLQMTLSDTKSISKVMEERRQRRVNSQPLDYPSCGSVFRNPENYNAWELIDGIGYRGKRHGGAMVSEKHCNFILNYDNASAQEYLELVNEIKDKVKEKYDVELKTEMEMFNWK